MSGKRSLIVLQMVLVAASLGVRPLLGQVTLTGALLQGTVQDPTGASVAGASVRIVNDATGIAESTSTDQAGRYLFGAPIRRV